MPSGEVSAIWISLGFEIMSSSGSPLSMSLRLKMITSVPGKQILLLSCQAPPDHPHTTHGSWILGAINSSLLTTVSRNLHELSHNFLFIVEGRILVDEFCLDGKLLHVVCDRFPGPSIPGGQWDYHLWRKHGQTL